MRPADLGLTPCPVGRRSYLVLRLKAYGVSVANALGDRETRAAPAPKTDHAARPGQRHRAQCDVPWSPVIGVFRKESGWATAPPERAFARPCATSPGRHSDVHPTRQPARAVIRPRGGDEALQRQRAPLAPTVVVTTTQGARTCRRRCGPACRAR